LNDAARLMAALYMPTAAEILEPLPAIGDVVSERLELIAKAPTVADVDALLREVSGLQAQLMRLRLALEREHATGATK
jgi:hypothetical protein